VLRPRVLLAEDDADLRRLMRWALRRDGCDVIESQNGQDLISYVQTCWMCSEAFPRPDLIVSDVHLTVDAEGPPDELDVLSRLRSVDRVTPVVLLAERVDASVCEQARRLGAIAVCGKPIDLDHLRRIVRSAVG
jgi:CheY-like chemotaxis protein